MLGSDSDRLLETDSVCVARSILNVLDAASGCSLTHRSVGFPMDYKSDISAFQHLSGFRCIAATSFGSSPTS